MERQKADYGYTLARQVLKEAGDSKSCSPETKAKLFEICGAWCLPNAVRMRKTRVSEFCAETNMADGDLHEKSQRSDALDASALDEGTRRSLLLAISYYASCVSARNSNYSNEELEAVLNHYNSYIRFVNGCSELDKAILTVSFGGTVSSIGLWQDVAPHNSDLRYLL